MFKTSVFTISHWICNTSIRKTFVSGSQFFITSISYPSEKKMSFNKGGDNYKKITADQNLIISDCLLSNPKLSICSTITAFKSGRLKELGDPISAVTLHLLEMLGKVSTWPPKQDLKYDTNGWYHERRNLTGPHLTHF